MSTMTIGRKRIKGETKFEGDPTREIVGYICRNCHRTYMALGWKPEPSLRKEPAETPAKEPTKKDKKKPGYCLHIFFLERVECGKDMKTRISGIVKKLKTLKAAKEAVKEYFPNVEIGTVKKEKEGNCWTASDPPIIWIKIHKDAEPCPPGWSKDVHVLSEKELEELGEEEVDG